MSMATDRDAPPSLGPVVDGLEALVAAAVAAAVVVAARWRQAVIPPSGSAWSAVQSRRLERAESILARLRELADDLRAP